MSKNILYILTAFILDGMLIYPQFEPFTDNFDSYTAGEQLACQNPQDWTTWNLVPCDPTTDPYISDNYSWTSDNTVVIQYNNDLVHIFNVDGALTSGEWYSSFFAFIPAGKAGYFNALAVFGGGISANWGMECYFDAGGVGRLLNGGTIPFTWPQDSWFKIEVRIDLDNDEAELLLGDNYPLQSIDIWQWTRGGTVPLSLDANDFFGATANDEMYVDNYVFDGDIPVELTSFSANVSGNSVMLNWQTATELNNWGFVVERSEIRGQWKKIGFVEGNGTTTEPKSYSFVDNLNSCSEQDFVPIGIGTQLNLSLSLSYRLKQIDFDGTYKCSNIVEVEVNKVTEFSLGQNYPNPFNPTTKINYSIPKDGYVSLKVFNVLGEQVAELVNGVVKSGEHQRTFDSGKLSSGIYYYRLESGENVSVKKMMILK